MKKNIVTFILILIFFSAQSHSGRTDSRGGHYNRKTGGYHYHNGGEISGRQITNTAQSINSTLLLAQKKLNELGYNCGIPDGIMGSKTKNAIMEFQRSKGLLPDGILGSKTTKELGLN